MIKKQFDQIFLFSENSRMKIKTAADILSKSSQRLKYSLKVLERERVLHNPFSIIDYSYFGLLLFRVYFKGAYVTEKEKKRIIKMLSHNKYVVAIYELSGEFDLVIEMQAPNPSRFNKELRNLSEMIPALRHFKVLLNVVTHFYPRCYLIKNARLYSQVKKHIIIGGDRGVERFDKREVEVIRNLWDKPKLRITELARNCDVHVNTAKKIMEDLVGRKVIRGFKYILNTSGMDIYKFRLFLDLHNVTNEREKQLQEYLTKTKEIIQANKTVGDWGLEIDIESLDKTKIRKLTLEIRERFKDIIKSVNIMEFYDQYKRSYLPGCLF